MTDAPDSEVRAIEDRLDTGEPGPGRPPLRRTICVILRDLLRPSRVWERTRLFWNAFSSFTLALSAVITVGCITC